MDAARSLGRPLVVRDDPDRPPSRTRPGRRPRRRGADHLAHRAGGRGGARRRWTGTAGGRQLRRRLRQRVRGGGERARRSRHQHPGRPRRGDRRRAFGLVLATSRGSSRPTGSCAPAPSGCGPQLFVGPTPAPAPRSGSSGWAASAWPSPAGPPPRHAHPRHRQPGVDRGGAGPRRDSADLPRLLREASSPCTAPLTPRPTT